MTISIPSTFGIKSNTKNTTKSSENSGRDISSTDGTASSLETGTTVATNEWTAAEIEKEKEILLNQNLTLAIRFRSLFRLKSINTLESIEIISKCFSDPSELLKHEVAYVLGQMKNISALPFLESVLADTLNQQSMVRHEAAEAIAAIGKKDSIEFLKQFLNDNEQVVRETVQLAIDGLLYTHSQLNADADNVVDENSPERLFGSIDPAPAAKKEYTTEQLKEQLMDNSLSLFERYRAMFALRNRGDKESVLALAAGFQDDSALFRHEIAYVFGQMQHEASVPSLIKVLSDTSEISMVRHEAAEALGSIATPECFPALNQFAKDENRTIRESCVVGLDLYEYETNPDQFESVLH